MASVPPERVPPPVYAFPEVEAKWQARWAAAGCFAASGDPARPRFFNFDGGPFPNGPLHMGHVRTFTLGDVMARYQRMLGKDVLYCLEFDAFGLPNELAARERGVSPEELTRQNIARISGQMRRLGLSYDWRHVHTTCDPRYYRWTQWLFLRLFERGLIYRAPADLNWCPSCMTTLAHMQVIEGRCWRCDSRVEQRALTQWFVRLSEYSPILFDTLSELDGWSDPMRHQLRGFLGPTHGVEVDYPVLGRPGRSLRAFGTEADAGSPAAYLAAALGHPAVEELLTGDPRLAALRAWSEPAKSAAGRAKRRRDGEEEREAAGFDSGLRVRDPFGGGTLPVYVATYVDPHFATGIEIGRPGANPRDAEFARAHGVGGDRAAGGAQTRPSGSDSCAPSSPDPLRPHPAGDEAPAVLRRVIHFRVRDWLVSRQRSWGTPIPVVHCDSCGVVPVPDRDLPVRLPAVFTDTPGRYGLAHYPDFVAVRCPACGRPARRETDTLDCYFDVVWCFLACATRLDDAFAFRPADFAHWMPVDWFHNGLDSFFYAHLYRFLGRVLFDLGILSSPEPIRRYHGHDAVLKDGRKMSKHHGNVVAPDAILERVGADVLRVHILWAAKPLKSVEWSDAQLDRARRFLESVWDLIAPHAGWLREMPAERPAGPPPTGRPLPLDRLLGRTVDRVTVFLEDYRYNACLEEIGTLVKAMAGVERELGRRDDAAERQSFARAVRALVLLLHPFAPHLTEELWERLGGPGLAATTAWPRGLDKSLR